MGTLNYILVNGYGWSGSSALVDLFREYKGFYVPKSEFRLIKDPHGLRDLDIQLNQSIDPLNEDNAIKEFMKFMNVYSRISGGFRRIGLSYKKEFGKSIEKKTQDYIDSLIDCIYSGHWWYLDIEKPYLKYIADKILHKLKIRDYIKYSKMYLTFKDEKEFIDLSKNYIDSIFSELVTKNNCQTVVLDQAIPANKPSWGKRYFRDSKVLVVDRDPRDVFVDLIKDKSLVGYDVAINHDVKLFIDWFLKVRENEPNCSGYLRIQFEDLILDYDNTVEKINNYCSINSYMHVDKGKKLIPNLSKKNIGMWKNYSYPDEIRIIEKELRDFIIQ